MSKIKFKDEEYYLKKYGVKKLMESPSGRKYLDKLREINKFDILQPQDKLFGKVYGRRK